MVRIACMCNTQHSTNEVGEKWVVHNVMHRWPIRCHIYTIYSMLWFVFIQWVALAFRTSPVATALCVHSSRVFLFHQCRPHHVVHKESSTPHPCPCASVVPSLLWVDSSNFFPFTHFTILLIHVSVVYLYYESVKTCFESLLDILENVAMKWQYQEGKSLTGLVFILLHLLGYNWELMLHWPLTPSIMFHWVEMGDTEFSLLWLSSLVLSRYLISWYFSKMTSLKVM